MQGRRNTVADIREILRCYRITNNIKETARTLGCAKGTVKRYVRWARVKGYLNRDDLPSEAELTQEWQDDDKGRAVVRASLEPYGEAIKSWIDEKIVLTRIYEMLVEGHEWKGSYETLKRFTLPFRQNKKACVRLEVAPGQEAQVDFGSAGLIWNPIQKRNRKAWVFLMTLSHSRHMYGEFVFSQDSTTWIACHRRAFEFFGGVPKKIILDNLKAAIIKAAIYDPMVNRTYRECAEHYGFLISPCIQGIPEHKGKVERGVPYVRKSFVAGRSFCDSTDANAQLIDWIMNKAGLRIHGTTKRQPVVVFDTVEQRALLPLPARPFSMVTWQEATVHPDCHVVVKGSFYSAPHRLRGEDVMVRLTDNMAYIFHNHQLIASHIQAKRPGTRQTLPGHYPPEKAAYLEKTPQWCLTRAKKIGPATHRLIDEILMRQHPLDGLRKAQGILALVRKFSSERLEAASKRALHFGTFTYQAIKRILEKQLDQEPLDQEEVTCKSMQRQFTFARPIEDFLLNTSTKEKRLWN